MKQYVEQSSHLLICICIFFLLLRFRYNKTKPTKKETKCHKSNSHRLTSTAQLIHICPYNSIKKFYIFCLQIVIFSKNKMHAIIYDSNFNGVYSKKGNIEFILFANRAKLLKIDLKRKFITCIHRRSTLNSFEIGSQFNF